MFLQLSENEASYPDVSGVFKLDTPENAGITLSAWSLPLEVATLPDADDELPVATPNPDSNIKIV